MITSKYVREFVENKGTKFATVKFIKKDGTERKINGLFKPKSHIVGNAKGQIVSEVMKSRGYIPIFSVADNAWKCFHEDNVVELT